MNRRAFLGYMGMGAAACLTGCATEREITEIRATKRPNIVYILADDLGYGNVSSLNPKSKVSTPNIDRIGSEGMTFTDAHSGSSVCSPTRYGILTGRYSWRSTMKSGVLHGDSPALIDPGRLTVASMLKKQGYRTACIGKWHLGLGWATTDGKPATVENIDYSKPITGGPCALGFDYFFGIPASLDMPPYLFVENDRAFEAPTDTIKGETGKLLMRGGPVAPHFKHRDVLPEFTRKAVGVIDDHAAHHSTEPLFMYVPFAAPHTPILPTGEFAGKSAGNEYTDFVAQVDASVGQIMAALERNGMDKDTLLIMTSDNGCAPTVDFKELAAKGHDPNGGMRGYKADIFEGGHHIPFLVRWPEHVKAGTRCEQTICLTDLMATAADVAGASVPGTAGEDSCSFMPALNGKIDAPLREATVHHSALGYFAIRQGQWKLLLCAGSGGWSEPVPQKAQEDPSLPGVQLYNLAHDPEERANVQGEHPDIVTNLTNLLRKYVEEGRSTPGPRQSNEGEINIWGPLGQKV